MSSHKDIEVEKERNSSLVSVSQKTVTIEKGSQPGTHKRDRDTFEQPILKQFSRSKKCKVARAQGTHTDSLKIKDFETES